MPSTNFVLEGSSRKDPETFDTSPESPKSKEQESSVKRLHLPVNTEDIEDHYIISRGPKTTTPRRRRNPPVYPIRGFREKMCTKGSGREWDCLTSS